MVVNVSGRGSRSDDKLLGHEVFPLKRRVGLSEPQKELTMSIQVVKGLAGARTYFREM